MLHVLIVFAVMLHVVISLLWIRSVMVITDARGAMRNFVSHAIIATQGEAVSNMKENAGETQKWIVSFTTPQATFAHALTA